MSESRRSKPFTGGVLLMVLASLGAGCASRSPVGVSTIDTKGTLAAPGATFGRAFNGQAFQFDGLTSFAGYQYTGFWKTDGGAPFVAISRRKLPDGLWSTIELRDSVMKAALNKKGEPWDVHNTVSIGICPGDGSLHVGYDHHGPPLRYRRTAPGVATSPDAIEWTPALFAPETNTLTKEVGVVTAITYPCFTRTPEGNLLLTFRRGGSGEGDWWIFRYDAKQHDWVEGHAYDSREGVYTEITPPSPKRCSYPNGWTFGPDAKLHVTYVYRETGGKKGGGNGSNHDLYHVWSDDQGTRWYNGAGQPIADARGLDGLPKAISLDSPGTRIWELPQTSSLMNTQTQAVDSNGRVHMVMWHRDPAKTSATRPVWDTPHCSYFHYWQDDTGKWQRRALPGPVGSRPRMVFDSKDNLFVAYTAPRVERDLTKQPSPGIFHGDSDLVIARASANRNWSDWSTFAKQPGPFISEPMIDVPRVADGVLSVMMQEYPVVEGPTTPLRVFDFKLR